MMEESAEGSNESRRKKMFRKGDILDLLSQHDNKVKEVANECAIELCDFDISDEDAMLVEDRMTRLSETIDKLSKKIYRIQNEFKNKKKMNSEMRKMKMEEIGISLSQYSIFDSQTLSDLDIDSGELKDRPDQYKKKPLNEDMTQRSRRRRVAEKRETLKKWSEEEGTTITELLGYLIYLDNYHSGEKSLASLGYRILREKRFLKILKSL